MIILSGDSISYGSSVLSLIVLQKACEVKTRALKEQFAEEKKAIVR
ncbi:MAG: hypothetical protein ACFFBS_10040 [Promethearchaeota archaeon]